MSVEETNIKEVEMHLTEENIQNLLREMTNELILSVLPLVQDNGFKIAMSIDPLAGSATPYTIKTEVPGLLGAGGFRDSFIISKDEHEKRLSDKP